MGLFRKLRILLALARWRNLAITGGVCPFCGFTVFVKFGNSEMAIFCLACRSNLVTLSLGDVLVREVPDLGDRHVYEISSRSPLSRCLLEHAGQVTLSQFFDDVARGEFKDNIQCQDVQKLTYPDASFDVCTSTEVFEHVADDARGFGEVHRVLRPGGRIVFTVPMHDFEATVERARMGDGGVEHLLEPEYHHDPILGPRSVLCFRNYGTDIVGRLKAAGFSEPRIVQAEDITGWGFSRKVIVAGKPA